MHPYSGYWFQYDAFPHLHIKENILTCRLNYRNNLMQGFLALLLHLHHSCLIVKIMIIMILHQLTVFLGYIKIVQFLFVIFHTFGSD